MDAHGPKDETTGEYERWEGDEARVEKLPTGYYVHYLGSVVLQTSAPQNIPM